MSFDSLMNLSGTVYRATRTRDALKSEAVVWTSLGTVACRLSALKATERAMLGGTGTDVTHRLYMRVPSYTILEKDEVEISSVRYEVMFVNDIDKMGHHLSVDVKELRHG